MDRETPPAVRADDCACCLWRLAVGDPVEFAFLQAFSLTFARIACDCVILASGSGRVKLNTIRPRWPRDLLFPSATGWTDLTAADGSSGHLQTDPFSFCTLELQIVCNSRAIRLRRPRERLIEKKDVIIGPSAAKIRDIDGDDQRSVGCVS